MLVSGLVEWPYEDDRGNPGALLVTQEEYDGAQRLVDNGTPRSFIDEAMFDLAEKHKANQKASILAELGGETAAITTRGVEELLIPYKQPWLIDGFMPSGALCMIQGRGGSLKSYVALDMAMAIATGGYALGRYRANQGGIYYVAAEGDSELGPRIAALIEARGYDPGMIRANFKWVGGPINLFRGQQTMDELKGELRRLKPDLLIIDTLSMVSGQADENGSQQVEVIKNIEVLRKEIAEGGSALVVHHTNKGDQDSRGASGIKDSARHVFHIKREFGSSHAEMMVVKSKFNLEGRRYAIQSDSFEITSGPRAGEKDYVLKEVDPGSIKGEVTGRAGGEVEVAIVDLLRSYERSGEISTSTRGLVAGTQRVRIGGSYRRLGLDEVNTATGDLVERGVLASVRIGGNKGTQFFLNHEVLVEQMRKEYPDKLLTSNESDPFDPALMAERDDIEQEDAQGDAA